MIDPCRYSRDRTYSKRLAAKRLELAASFGNYFGLEILNVPPLVALRAGFKNPMVGSLGCCAPARDRPRRRRAAKQRYELASFQLIELHSDPLARAGLQDIELVARSQRVSERLYNLLAIGEGGRCSSYMVLVDGSMLPLADQMR